MNPSGDEYKTCGHFRETENDGDVLPASFDFTAAGMYNVSHGVIAGFSIKAGTGAKHVVILNTLFRKGMQGRRDQGAGEETTKPDRNPFIYHDVRGFAGRFVLAVWGGIP